jgi:hypothetical protein
LTVLDGDGGRGCVVEMDGGACTSRGRIAEAWVLQAAESRTERSRRGVKNAIVDVWCDFFG